MFGDSQGIGHPQTDAGELGKAGGERQADRCGSQARQRRANGIGTIESRACARQDGARHLKKPPTRLAAPLMHRNTGEYTARTRTVADSFLEVLTPSKNMAQGKLRTRLWRHRKVNPFRKLI